MLARTAIAASTGALEQVQAEAAAMRRRLRAAAHEIRTPLTGAATIVDILAVSELASGPTRDYVLLLKDAVAQIIAVTNDILDLGRLEADLGLGTREAFSPADLVAATAGLAEPRARAKGLTLAVVAGGLPERVIGHPVMVRRALENLIDNAVKHTVQGGITVTAALDGGRMLVSVADTGAGIEPEDLPLLFEPYAQLAGGVRAGGTGLGLALVRSAIERVGGTVEVESAVGRGTVFRFAVPVDPAHGVLPAVKATGSARRPLSILVAEDNPVNRIVTGAILGEFGHRVSFSADGRAAVDALQRHDYDLVLMDIEMPHLDGPSALAAIRALPGARAGTPVVALSARGAEARDEALGQGFDAYVAKPIDPAALFAAIEESSRKD